MACRLFAQAWYKPEIMKKLNLRLNPGEEPGMVLIGISSHENDYRLVWAINNIMKFKFVRIPILYLTYQLTMSLPG
jgi:hypothetical protein